ncbi:unnamed protein product [Tetraodon nigroviridis]|uniref:(spotted green pufferfish) hypothetical protein n=1 Tax=Tetraodon nigroviridis TaxID=99883 RepID=Q4T9P4_TETNG|nr:unnamed protein product [Tetraodon nigroviridis]
MERLTVQMEAGNLVKDGMTGHTSVKHQKCLPQIQAQHLEIEQVWTSAVATQV